MKAKMLSVTLSSILVSSQALAVQEPTLYSYHVALFNGEELLYEHASITSSINQFSDGKTLAYLVKSCEKKGTKTINRTGGKGFVEEIGYRIDLHTAALQFHEIVIDDSTYVKPKESELELCINTGEPQEHEYEYNAKFDLTKSGVQRFTFDNNRAVEIAIQKQS